NVLSPPTTEDRQRWMNSRTEAWAARYGDSWHKVAALMDASRVYEIRLRRKTQLLGFSLGVLALLVIVGIIWGAKVYDDATKALEKLYAEQARVIWSEMGSDPGDYLTYDQPGYLTPRQRNALWQLARVEAQVKKRFVELLSQDADL